MNDRFALKIKHLDNLLDKQSYAFLAKHNKNGYLTLSSFRLLEYLFEHQNEDVNPIELGKVISATKATVSKMLTGLEKDGLIRRKQSKQDGRYWYVYLTAKGKKLYLENKGAGEEIDNMLTGVLSKSDITAFNRVYKKVVAALSEPEQE